MVGLRWREGRGLKFTTGHIRRQKKSRLVVDTAGIRGNRKGKGLEDPTLRITSTEQCCW